jgi:RNA polymerase sigma factor for flagellar operon FliA
MNAAVETNEITGQNRLSADERDRLILENLPQVRLIARRIYGRLPGNISLDDLISTGTVGLISAIDHFDASRNLLLKTYAEHKIRGAILDSLRRQDWAPREQRKRAKQIQAAIAVTEQRLHRSPTEAEIAAHLELTVDQLHQWQVETSGVNLGTMETAGRDRSEDRDLLNVISDDEREWPSAKFESKELQRVLMAAILEIPEVEKTILGLYYHEELTLREISLIVGLHESRISQLRSQAILRLRARMAKLWPTSGGDAMVTDKPQARKPKVPATLLVPAAATRYSVQAC